VDGGRVMALATQITKDKSIPAHEALIGLIRS